MNRSHQPPENLRGRRNLYYIIVSLLFLAAGIGSVWFAQSFLRVQGDAILVALLVVPSALYLTLSGRVSEIAAGNLSLKLREVSSKPVGQSATQYVIADLAVQMDAARPTKKTDPNRAKVVTLIHGSGQYERDLVLSKLISLAEVSPVLFLIILDDRQRVLAYMTYRSALDLLKRPGRGDQFINLVKTGKLDAFDDGGGFSAIKTEILLNSATNAEALSLMERMGLDALVVVDRKGRFEGIIERDRMLSRMMLAMVT